MASPTRRVEQVAEAIARDAAALAADLQPNDPPAWLPTWDELAARHAASKSTVRAALTLLAQRGVIEVVPRTGARVLPPRRISRRPEHQATTRGRWRGFPLAAAEAGVMAWHEVTSVRTVPAGPDVASYLHLPPGTAVVQKARLHGGDLPGRGRTPAQRSWTWFHPTVTAEMGDVLLATDTGPGGITSRFIDAGLLTPPPQWKEVIIARMASVEDAVALDVRPGAALIEAWRTCSDAATGRVLEVTLRLIRPDVHELEFP